MTEKTCKWAEVPDRALVRASKLIYRRGDRALVIDSPLVSSMPWSTVVAENVTIVALDVADATIENLRWLAEVLEITARLYNGAGHGVAFEDLVRNGCGGDDGPLADYNVDAGPCHAPPRRALAERLHALGFRANGTAEDAARLLSEAAK